MTRALLVAGSATTFALGCSSPSGELTGTSDEAIVSGTPATTYTEAALLNIDMTASGGYLCSATLIAPKVVLTAGHCVDTHTKWEVYVGTQYRLSTSAVTYDWNEHGAETINPNHHDIGLVFLPTAITLASYPTIATAPAAASASLVNVGRILNGVITNSLYQRATTITPGASVGYPLDYVASDVIEHGDSGGPDFLAGTHQIDAVNSGAGGGTEVLARVDLVAAWIATEIASHGGAGPSADAGAATVADAGTSGTAPKDAGVVDAAPPSCGPGAEVEANNTYATANPFVGGAACGALSTTTDQDWFWFESGASSVTLSLTASGDAEMQIGQDVSGSCAASLTGIHSFTASVTSARRYCVRVVSLAGKEQTYSLTEH